MWAYWMDVAYMENNLKLLVMQMESWIPMYQIESHLDLHYNWILMTGSLDLEMRNWGNQHPMKIQNQVLHKNLVLNKSLVSLSQELKAVIKYCIQGLNMMVSELLVAYIELWVLQVQVQMLDMIDMMDRIEAVVAWVHLHNYHFRNYHLLCKGRLRVVGVKSLVQEVDHPKKILQDNIFDDI